jgi:DNA-directed RNA polymerase specialized sigma24 family protein
MYDSAADEEILAILRKENFEGPAWECFRDELVGVALPRMRFWIATGTVFTFWGQGRMHGSPPPFRPAISADDAEEMAGETVARALVKYRTVLADGGWSAAKGASLLTFFDRQCMFKFPAVYRHWLHTTHKPYERLVPGDDQPDITDDRLDGGDLATSYLVVADELLDVPDPFERAVVWLRCVGYTARQSGEELGVGPRKIERALAQYRRRRRPGGKGRRTR